MSPGPRLPLASLIALLVVATSSAHAARKPRGKVCAGALDPIAGLRGVGGPRDQAHTARLSVDGKNLILVAGANELSPLVARIRIPREVLAALRAGDLEALDGVELVAGDARLRFSIDGADFQDNVRRRLSGEFRGVAFKISGCSPYREGRTLD